VREKVGDIFLAKEGGRCVAYWHPANGSPDAFLCALDLDAYTKHPHLRDLFVELATETALNLQRAAGEGVTLATRGSAYRMEVKCRDVDTVIDRTD
jgi:hypothetical protein